MYTFFMNTLQLITDKLKNAGLPNAEMALWEDVLGNMPDESLEIIKSFIDVEVGAIDILTKNLVSKDEALKNKDIDQLEQLLQNDAGIVNSL